MTTSGLVKYLFVSVFLITPTILLIIPSPASDIGVLLVWLLCAVGIGFVLHRWWALPLAFGPGPLSSLYQRTLGGGAGDGEIEAWRFIAGMIIFAAIFMASAAIGWGIWRLLEIIWIDRLDQVE